MTSWTEWVLGTVAAALAGAVVWVARIVSDLPQAYVPRPQVDARFRELEERLQAQLAAQESRSDRQFDKLDRKLDQIIVLLDRKADK